MVRWARYVFAVLAALFLIGVVVQTFYAGLGLFAGAENMQLHVDLGWILHLAPILVLIAAALGRVGRATMLWTAALVVTVFIQPLLPGLSESVPALAALHPVNALLIFWISVVVVRRALALARSTPADASAHPATA
jgi:hypothetical protein